MCPWSRGTCSESTGVVAVGRPVRLASLFRRSDHADAGHHPAVLVFEDVAVVDEVARDRERDVDHLRVGLAGARVPGRDGFAIAAAVHASDSPISKPPPIMTLIRLCAVVISARPAI